MSTDALPTYSRTYLALRNGQDKPEIWVAYKGMIYDVSRSRLWRAGKHYEHWAGQDLTDELEMLPTMKMCLISSKSLGCWSINHYLSGTSTHIYHLFFLLLTRFSFVE